MNDKTWITKKWIEFTELLPMEQDKIKLEWEEYYKSVPLTKAYKRYQKIKELFKAGRAILALQFCKKAKEQE